MNSLRQALRVLAVALAGWTVTALFQGSRVKVPQPVEEGTMTCALALQGWQSPAMHFSAGFQYELLTLLEQHFPWEFDISLTGRPSGTDSLPSADLLVLPAADVRFISDSCYVSEILPDSTVWVIPYSRENLVHGVRAWTAAHFNSASFEALGARFTPSYNPYRRIGPRISPYDDLLKTYAARIGWDWRMLAALVWKESKFHIEARSKAGAEGLMQMMPHTARKHKADNMLDPEENLRAATEYILRLQRMFADRAADPEELTRFTLAAYNAGEGRILDLIHHAEELGKPYSRWADLESLLPASQDQDMQDQDMQDQDMQDQDMQERQDGFQGHETVRFVKEIEALYAMYRNP